MKMTELLRYDVPPEIVKLWQEQESECLLPLQELAVRGYNLFGDGNLLIQAPTSSGKTFIGEMAAIQTALRRKKVVYLVPLKALAEEKYLDFCEKYAPYGIRLIVSTRDHRQFDHRFEEGDFSLAVVIYEKLSQLLVRRPERLEEIELILVDELELLSDPERGAEVEILLTRIRQTPCRLIGLSAVIGHADKLAEWMGAELIAHDQRPVELRYGVLHQGIFRYRTYNEYTEAEEQLIEGPLESPWDTLVENLLAFVERDEPCLVFVKAKRESRRGAELLAQRVNHPAATQAVEELRRLEPTHSRDVLLETLNSGVAFHNADLSPEERRVVEGAFRRGDVKVMISTSTLALGMNLPAQNVFIAADKWRYDSRFGMPWKSPILRAEYENMGGRAGRYGSGNAFGRSILIASTPFDQETLWRRYVDGERETVEPQLVRTPLEDHVLRLIASRACESMAALQTLLENTLTGQWVWSKTLTPEEIAFRVSAAVTRTLDAGMITSELEDRLAATPFGAAAAAKGITLATAQELKQWIAESETRSWIDLDLLLAAALTPDGRVLQVSLTAREYEHADYPDMLKRLAQDEDLAADVPLNRLRNCTLTPFFEEVRAIKVALFLSEWIDHASVYDLEAKYRTMAGQILAAAGQISWLISAAASIAEAFGAATEFVERIEKLSERIQHGLREEALPLARLNLPELSRNIVITLTSMGLHTPKTLAETPIDVLAQWLPRPDARALREWALQRLAAEGRVKDVSPPDRPAPTLIIDGKRPTEIILDGKPIRLQEKQYRLIRTLAGSPGECVPYEIIYQAVWGDSIVEPNQMHFQKRRLLERVKAALPERARLVTTIPKRGFVLNLAPEQVALRQGHVRTTAHAGT